MIPSVKYLYVEVFSELDKLWWSAVDDVLDAGLSLRDYAYKVKGKSCRQRAEISLFYNVKADKKQINGQFLIHFFFIMFDYLLMLEQKGVRLPCSNTKVKAKSFHKEPLRLHVTFFRLRETFQTVWVLSFPGHWQVQEKNSKITSWKPWQSERRPTAVGKWLWVHYYSTPIAT